MGKGDRKTRKGKIWRGSHGKKRPKKEQSGAQTQEDAGSRTDKSGQKEKQPQKTR